MITYKILKLLSVLVVAHNYVHGSNDTHVNSNTHSSKSIILQNQHFSTHQTSEQKELLPMLKRGKRSYSFIDERAKNSRNSQPTSGRLLRYNIKNYSRKQAEQDLNNYIKYPLNWRCNHLNGEYAYFNKKDEARKGNSSNSSDQTTENLPFGNEISCLDISFGKDYSSNNSNSVLDSSNTGNSKNHLIKQSEDTSALIDTSNYDNNHLGKICGCCNESSTGNNGAIFTRIPTGDIYNSDNSTSTKQICSSSNSDSGSSLLDVTFDKRKFPNNNSVKPGKGDKLSESESSINSDSKLNSMLDHSGSASASETMSDKIRLGWCTRCNIF